MAKNDALMLDDELKESLCKAIDKWICPVERVHTGFREIRDRYSRAAVSIMVTTGTNAAESADAR